MKLPRILSSLVRNSNGATALELGFIIPPFVLMLLGIAQFGHVYWARHSLQFGCDQGIRYALANPDAPPSTIETVVRDNINGFDPEDLTVSVVPETVNTVPFLDISASYTYALSFAFIDLGSIDILAKARAPLGTPPPPV